MPAPRRLDLTHDAISALPFARKRQQVFYWDKALPGFGVRVTKTSKSLIVQFRHGGSTCREQICRYLTVRYWVGPPMTVETARERAYQRLAEIKKAKERNDESGYADRWAARYRPTTSTPPEAPNTATGTKRAVSDKRGQLLDQLVNIANRMKLDELERLVTQASKRV